MKKFAVFSTVDWRKRIDRKREDLMEAVELLIKRHQLARAPRAFWRFNNIFLLVII